MSAEREESLPEYAMRVTLERDEALRQLRTAEQAMWQHIAGCSGYKPPTPRREQHAAMSLTPGAVDWARRAMANVSPLLSEMEEDKP